MKEKTAGMFSGVPVNAFLRDRFYLSTVPSATENRFAGSEDAAAVAPAPVNSSDILDLRRKQSLQQLVDKLCDPWAESALTGARFMELTKKMRQQIMSKLLSRLRNQLVVYNVKSLFRIYMVFHRDDRLIHTICDVFAKQRVYNLRRLRAEIVAKNTKPYQRKIMRNQVCNEVMARHPNLLRLFDNRLLNYYDRMLRETSDALHQVATRLPVIVCLNASDVDTMITTCRLAFSRRHDFPLHLLPHSLRLPFARLFDMHEEVARLQRRASLR